MRNRICCAQTAALSRQPRRSSAYSFSRSVRLYSTAAAIAAACAGVMLRLWVLQIEEHEQWRARAEQQQESALVVHAARGNILDREGRTLATSRPAFALALHPRKVRDADALSAGLARLTGRPEAYVRQKIDSPSPFVWLERGIPWSVRRELEQIRDPGLAVIKDFVRLYPQGNLAGPILGRVSRDGAGQAGIEAQFNARLAANDSRLSGNRDAHGRPSAAYTPAAAAVRSEHVRPEGSDVQLTIDAVIQSIVEREVERGAADSRAKTVFAVVTDSDSGEVLALAQSDAFNPTAPSITSVSSLRNRIIQDAFEPGSTMKAIVGALAIEHGAVRSEDIVDCGKGSHRFGRRTIHDVHPVGIVPFREAIVRSSNICLAKVAYELGKRRLWRELTNFGFGAPTGVELPGETAGILRNHSEWADIDVATHAFGHGVSVNALQLASAFSAIINGGRYHSPTIVMRPSAKSGRRVLREETSRSMRSILRDVVVGEHGTARRADIPGVLVMGKTGTAQKVRVDGRGYDGERVVASFVGAVEVPDGANLRRLTMLVVVDEPNVVPRWGGTVAAPVFRRAMEDILRYLVPQHRSIVAAALENADQPDARAFAL